MSRIITVGSDPWKLNILDLPREGNIEETVMQLVLWVEWKIHRAMANCNRDTFTLQANYLSQISDLNWWDISPIEWKLPKNITELMAGNEIIPVILQNQNGTLYYIANMNEEAIKNTKRDGQLWVYSKTNKQLQKKWATSGDFIGVYTDSFAYGTSHDGQHFARVLVLPTTESVCHEKNPKTGKWYPTCFFREIPEAGK